MFFFKTAYLIATVTLCLFLTDATLAQIQRLDYNDLQRIILHRNGAVQRTFILANADKTRTGFLQRSQEPKWATSVGGDLFQFGTSNPIQVQSVGQITLEVPLYQNGYEAAEENIRQAQASLSNMQIAQTIAEQLALAQKSYWEIVYIDEMIQNIQNLQTQAQKIYASAQHRYKRGLVPKSDLLQFELYCSRLQADIENLQNQKTIELIALRSLLGLSEYTTLEIVDKTLPHPRQTMETNSIPTAQIIALSMLTKEVDIATFKRDQTQNRGKPTLDAFGTYGLYTKDAPIASWTDRIEATVGIRAQFLLYDGKEQQTEILVETQKLDASSIDQIYHSQAIRAAIKGAQEDALRLHTHMNQGKKQLVQAKQFLETLHQEYDRGVKDATDMISGLHLYEEIHEQYTSTKKAYQEKKSQITALLFPEKTEKEETSANTGVQAI